MISSLIALPIMIPLAGAALALVFRQRERIQMVISISALTAVLAISGYLLTATDRLGVVQLNIGGWAADLGIVLVLDRFSALMLTVSAVVTLVVLVYSSAQRVSEGSDRAPLAVFHPTYLVLVAGVSNAFLAGDLFNLYVGFEILLSASYVLLTLGATRSRIRAGITYVIVSLLSSMIFLAGVALAYMAAGTVNLALLAVRLDHVDPTVRMTLELVLLVAFAIKAAIFPLSSWLPDSYPTAPAPVTAVFAGLLTKVGVYAIVRIETLLFPESDVSYLLMIAAGLTLVVGILGAVAQTDLKRVLSFTLVSHMGYMVFGIGLTTQASMTGTVYYIAHHITVQTVLFLVAGLIEQKAGSTNLARLGGLARLAPVIAVLFFVPAMNLSGIPPFSGFFGKLALMQAGIAYDTALAWVLVALAMTTSLLTLYAIAKIWNRAFWQRPSEEVVERTSRPLPKVMIGSTAALLGANLCLTIFAGPIVDYADRAASNLLQRSPYVQSVLGEDAADDLVFVTDPSRRVGVN